MQGTRLSTQDERWDLLAQLVDGAGVVVHTGPLGAPFWTAASPEVVVRVEPDGYEVSERNPIADDNGLLWSLRINGLSSTEANVLLRGRTRAPKASHQHSSRWEQAALDRARLLLLHEGAVRLEVEDFAVTVIEDPAEQLRFLEGLNEFAALDWEWDPHDPTQTDGLSVATRSDTFYLPVRASDYRVPAGHGVRLRAMFSQKLRAGLPCVFHQGRADLSYQYDGDPAELSGKPIHDTLIMMFLADPTADDLGLKPSVRKRLGREPSSFPGALSELPLARGARYAGADARNTFDLFMDLIPELMAKDQWSVYTTYEQPLMPIIASMEKFGQPVDVPELIKQFEEHQDYEDRLQQAVATAYGIDLSSDDETKNWLKDITGYRPAKLDQRSISKWQQGEVDVILEYRQTRTRRRSFLAKNLKRWDELGRPERFLLYPKFNQAGKDNADQTVGRSARSGRLTSSGSKNKWERAYGAPNFQNQPRAIRDIYCAPDGMLFFSRDFAGMELRIAAGISGDPAMLHALNTGEDLHGLFRAKILELTGIDVGRPSAKAGNFEQLYGGGAGQLVRILRKQRAFISLETAEAIVAGHEYAFPVYHNWARGVVQLCRERGYSETLFGRRRYLPELFSADSEVRSNAERAAVNHVIQGTAADIVKLAMVSVSNILLEYGGHLALQVHDELCGWVPETINIDECMARVDAAMTGIKIPGIDMLVEGSVGRTWGDAH